MNIHILSDSPKGTSAYASIARNLSRGLERYGHTVSITGFQTYFAPENYNGITVYPLLNPIEPNNSQIEQFKKNLRKSGADVLICVYQADSHFNIYSLIFTPTYFWVPVEGQGIRTGMRACLQSPDIRVVSQSYAGKIELDAEQIPCSVLYPGWNSEIITQDPKMYCKWSTELHRQTAYQPVLYDRGCWNCCGSDESCPHFEGETLQVKYMDTEFSGEVSTVRDMRDNLGVEFVVGCVATNMGVRKRLERLISAFALFTEENTDALLHIHTSLSFGGVPVLDLINKNDISKNVVLSCGEYPFGVSDKAINQLYNYFDVNATASGAEGFGMTHLESMAVGVPQIAPDFSTFPELLGKSGERGLLAELSCTYRHENGVVYGLVDETSLKNAMCDLYSDTVLRQRMGQAGIEWAKQFTWDKISESWNEILRRK